MKNLTDIDYVTGLKSNMEVTFNSPQGKEVLEYLEESCGWYQSVFNVQSPELTLINDGKRQVIATIKTIMRYTPTEIVALIKSKEQ